MLQDQRCLGSYTEPYIHSSATKKGDDSWKTGNRRNRNLGLSPTSGTYELKYKGDWGHVRDLLGIYKSLFCKAIQGRDGVTAADEQFLMGRIVRPDEPFSAFFQRTIETSLTQAGPRKRLAWLVGTPFRALLPKSRVIAIQEGFPLKSPYGFNVEGSVPEQQFNIRIRVGKNDFTDSAAQIAWSLHAYLESHGETHLWQWKPWP